MVAQNPIRTTWGDLLTQALRDCGFLGIGTRASAEALQDAAVRCQWMLETWQNERKLVYHTVTYTVKSDGRTVPYRIGPHGGNVVPDIDLGAEGLVSRPNRLESVFFQQDVGGMQGPLRWGLRLLQTMEDYNKIALPQQVNFALTAFYDPAWSMGQLYVWPWPLANVYSIGVTVREQLPASFGQGGNGLANVINLPFAYYEAIVSNLAMRLRVPYGIPTQPGDPLPTIARNSLKVLRAANTVVGQLQMPPGLSGSGMYNIFNDRNY